MPPRGREIRGATDAALSLGPAPCLGEKQPCLSHGVGVALSRDPHHQRQRSAHKRTVPSSQGRAAPQRSCRLPVLKALEPRLAVIAARHANCLTKMCSSGKYLLCVLSVYVLQLGTHQAPQGKAHGNLPALRIPEW